MTVQSMTQNKVGVAMVCYNCAQYVDVVHV